MRRRAASEAAIFDDLARQALSHGQVLRLRATSTSMWPEIKPGDRLLARRERLQPGDIAVVRPGTRLVTHRVLAVSGASVALRGAAGGRPLRVAASAVLGRVIAIQRPWWRRLAESLGVTFQRMQKAPE